MFLKITNERVQIDEKSVSCMISKIYISTQLYMSIYQQPIHLMDFY